MQTRSKCNGRESSFLSEFVTILGSSPLLESQSNKNLPEKIRISEEVRKSPSKKSRPAREIERLKQEKAGPVRKIESAKKESQSDRRFGTDKKEFESDRGTRRLRNASSERRIALSPEPTETESDFEALSSSSFSSSSSYSSAFSIELPTRMLPKEVEARRPPNRELQQLFGDLCSNKGKEIIIKKYN